MALELTTLENVKLMHGGGFSSAAADPTLTRLIKVVSRRIERWLDAEFLLVARTEVYDLDVAQAMLMLKAYPVAASPAIVVKNDTYGAFDSVTAIDSTLYAVNRDRGILHFRNVLNPGLLYGPQVLQVVYTGGIAANSKTISDDFADLQSACEMQVLHMFQRKPNFGSPGRSVAGGSQQFEDDDEDSGLIPTVKRLLEQYRRG